MSTTSGTWDPAVYESFSTLRSAPFHDLVAKVGTVPPSPSIVDLGCGTGALTATLADTFDSSDVLGVDSSPEMLGEAAAHAGDRVRFEQGDIATFERPHSFDLVISNAALHWTDDHVTTLTRWATSLRVDGQLAVQVPANFDHPSHTVAAEVAGDAHFDGRWTTGHPPTGRGDHVLTPGQYANVLHDLGFAEQSVDLHVYPMVLGSSDQVLDWVRGTLLVPYRAALSPSDYAEFERRYAARLTLVLGGRRAPYFYGFERILMWGRRGR